MEHICEEAGPDLSLLKFCFSRRVCEAREGAARTHTFSSLGLLKSLRSIRAFCLEAPTHHPPAPWGSLGKSLWRVSSRTPLCPQGLQVCLPHIRLEKGSSQSSLPTHTLVASVHMVASEPPHVSKVQELRGPCAHFTLPSLCPQRLVKYHGKERLPRVRQVQVTDVLEMACTGSWELAVKSSGIL